MSTYREEKLTEISGKFQIYGQVMHAESCKIGHINETYSATYDQGGTRVRYIHQKINQHVFKDPEGVMDNIMRVTGHIQKKLRDENTSEPTRRTLTVVPARDGRSFYRDDDGEYWRTFVYVERTQTFEAVQTPAQALEAPAGRAPVAQAIGAHHPCTGGRRARGGFGARGRFPASREIGRAHV